MPHLSRWHDAIAARPAVPRGITIPEDASTRLKDTDAAKKFADDARTMVEMSKPAA